MEMMPKARKYIRIGFIIVALLTVIVLCTGWYLSRHWKKVLNTQLKEYVKDMSDSLYTLQYADLHLNVLAGTISLHKASLVIDTAVYRKLREQQKAPSFLYTLSVDDLELRHVKLWRYFGQKEVNAGALVLQSPHIILEQNAGNIDTSQKRTAYQNISSKIKSLYIGRLLLDNSHLKYTYIKKDSSLMMTELHELKVNVNDLLIDSIALKDPTRFLYARNYELDLHNYRHRTKDSLYWMHIRDVHYSAAERTFTIGQFEVEPRYNKADFDKQIGTQQDRFHVRLDGINIRNLRPTELLQDQVIWADKIDINGGLVDIYRNRTLPMPPGNKLGQYPNQLLAKLPIPVRIDSLEGSRVHIKYTELSPESNQSGVVSFKNTHGLFRNITNMDSLVAQNNHCIADMDAIFMESGKLMARFDFILGDKAGSFGVSGQLKSMNGKQLTPITQPLGKIEIKSCNIQDLTFTIKGNEKSAAGTVKFIYNDLKIAILKQEGNSQQYKRKGLLSLVANALVIKDSNPLPGEGVRVSHPQYTRDIKKSFFNLVWKTLFTGVKETAGTGRL
ncbi:hypothetical protein [Chitinophaga defluvii]|uniref:AsmA-like protein n=1 Tax=Chitinophaga defluvii TaxID=3163343 RepID=A0ABV2TBN2_9BACT